VQFFPDRNCCSHPLLLAPVLAVLFGLGCGNPSSTDRDGSGSAMSAGGAVAGSGGSGGQGGAGGNATGGVGSGGTLAGSGDSGTGGTLPGTGGSTVTPGNGGTQAGGKGGVVVGGGTGSAGVSGVGGARQGGSGGRGGVTGSGGVAGSTASSPGGSVGSCSGSPRNQYPFGCKFAWGIGSPSGSLGSYSYLQFVSNWVESSISAAGSLSTCSGCSWLTSKVAGTNFIPVYYAYIIGFYGHANGIVDGNQTGNKKLTTDGAAFIKANYNTIVNAYAWYAKQTAAAWPSKPLVWLLEGDFVQFSDKAQSSPLSYAELGKLAADITCAIKTNMPNAAVAINHSGWNANDVTKGYWGAMESVDYDMVWTTGVGDGNGFIPANTTASSYNGATATYAYLHTLTGRTILVDTSAGASSAGDSWSTAGATQLNARISEGVIAANITGTPPSGLQGNISGLSNLSSIPSCQ
jgi:hypothetical protein